jgi:hypothetical protein
MLALSPQPYSLCARPWHDSVDNTYLATGKVPANSPECVPSTAGSIITHHVYAQILSPEDCFYFYCSSGKWIKTWERIR